MKKSDFILAGFEDLEISTQIIIRAAQKRGVDVEILNRKAHFLKLQKNSNIEYVKEATKTSKDSYITFLMMEDKSVSKYMLSKSGVKTPEGMIFSSQNEALEYFAHIKDKPVVIKPNATNFGIGVHVFANGINNSQYIQAVTDAFSHDSSILVEEFIKGNEYRFLVINNKCIAVCNRIPANVTGDGVLDIQQLVELKNKDIRRGVGHITPLEVIEIDQTVISHLNNQNINLESIPAKDEIVYLRQNSNISTGGDSIDITDEMHVDFFEIARRSAASVDASICGVDIMIADPKQSPLDQNYAVIEINFNPVLYIHEYPYEGQGRNTGEHVMDLLGFD